MPSSDSTQTDIEVTEFQLEHLNKTLAKLTPQEVIEWTLITFPNVFQTTAFGLTGLCILDMLDKLRTKHEPIDLVFIDTLYHFPQTLDLIENVKSKYNQFNLHIYKPQDPKTGKDFESEIGFEALYGGELWLKDELKYDYLVKVEPLQRAHRNLNIKAVFTGRRRSQGGLRSDLPIIEIDKSLNVIKISPLASWDFNDVHSYIKENNVPYNELLDLGYKSIGDWHSTEPIQEGEDERSGRWKGKAKTECGIHTTSKYAEYLNNQKNAS